MISRQERNQIVMDNIGLVYMVLKRFGGRGYEMEDLFQIGVIGLTKAAERFDFKLGYTFSTYAVPLIIGEIKRFLRDDGLVHVSRSNKELAIKIARVKEDYEKQNGKEPTVLEVAEILKITVEEVLNGLEANVIVDSLYAPIVGEHTKESRTDCIVDVLCDENADQTNLIDSIALSEAIKKLSSREQRVIQLRYINGKTQAEVAKLIGVNQVAVSRMEKKILLQLRKDFVYNT